MPNDPQERAYLVAKAPKRSKIVSVCSFILVTELCERLAYYGLTGSLPIFFHKQLQMTSILATELNNAFSSLSYLTPLVGAYIADRYLGRFSTIMLFSTVYLMGMLLCVYGAWPGAGTDKTSIFMVGLFMGVAFGAGGIKPNVVVLGADQFDLRIASERKEKESFFNWFYWAINIGATISYGVLTNVAVNGIPPYIPREYGFFASFLLPTLVFGLGLCIFYSGRARYRRIPPSGSALLEFMAILMEAGLQSGRGSVILSAGAAIVPGILLTIVSYFIQDPLAHLILALVGAACVLFGTVSFIVFGGSTDWLQRACDRNGGTFSAQKVNAASQVVRLSPYLSFIVIFWTVYGQQSSNFVLQGCQMDLRLGNRDAISPPMVSSAMLSILDSSVILAFIPIFDRYLYPFLRSLGLRITTLSKIGAGLFCSFLAMLMAAYVEYERKRSGHVLHIPSNCASADEDLMMSTMSVWWQTPQYLLIGISEILTSISAYDLFYSEVPASMRSVCQALNLLTTSLGYIVGGALNSIFSFWIPSDLNQGHLEYIFLAISLLVLMHWVAFCIVSRSFESHQDKSADTQDIISGFSPALPRAARQHSKQKN